MHKLNIGVSSIRSCICVTASIAPRYTGWQWALERSRNITPFLKISHASSAYSSSSSSSSTSPMLLVNSWRLGSIIVSHAWRMRRTSRPLGLHNQSGFKTKGISTSTMHVMLLFCSHGQSVKFQFLSSHREVCSYVCVYMRLCVCIYQHAQRNIRHTK